MQFKKKIQHKCLYTTESEKGVNDIYDSNQGCQLKISAGYTLPRTCCGDLVGGACRGAYIDYLVLCSLIFTRFFFFFILVFLFSYVFLLLSNKYKKYSILFRCKISYVKVVTLLDNIRRFLRRSF